MTKAKDRDFWIDSGKLLRSIRLAGGGFLMTKTLIRGVKPGDIVKRTVNGKLVVVTKVIRRRRHLVRIVYSTADGYHTAFGQSVPIRLFERPTSAELVEARLLGRLPSWSGESK